MVNSSHRDFVITTKILREIDDINSFIQGMKAADYLSDLRTQKAVLMSLINIGELCGSYSQRFLDEYQEIPWKQIRAMRNIAAHKYETVSHEDVWETINSDLPVLEDTLRKDSIFHIK